MIMSHPRVWVALVYFFPKQSHHLSHGQQFVSDMGLFLYQEVSSSFHDQQLVSDTTLFLCQAVSSILPHLVTNRKWVTLVYFHAWHSIVWPTGSKLPLVYSWQSTLTYHISSHDHQSVSDIGLFFCQVASSIMSHPMMNREWVTLLYFFPKQSHQSCLIPWPTACEWH